MKKQFKFFWLAAAAVALVSVPGCKDDDKPSTIPTQPTTMNIDNGAVISETEVTLSVSGSTVEDEECSINYNYYIGTSQDNLEKTNPQKIKLTPYTQYFWYANAETLRDYSEPTEIRTFYCVPPFEIETDNGDGEWAAVLRFKGLSNINGGKVTLTPDKQGYNYQKEIEIPAGQDSCYIKMGNEHNPTNAAFTHLYDDEHGITYEPIIYTFNATIDVQVGDKSFAVSKEAKEIILDTKHYIHDYDYNVYRLVRIGNQIWTADNIVSTSYCYENAIYGLSKYVGLELPSGAKSRAYYILDYDGLSLITILNDYIVPKGFHISTIDDWLELERYYGVDIDDSKEVEEYGTLAYGYLDPTYRYFQIKYLSDDVYEGENVEIRSKLSSQYEWYDTTGVAINNVQSPFNAKPFGLDKETAGCGVVFFAYDKQGEHQGIVMTNYLNGIIRKKAVSKSLFSKACIRLVKDK